MEHALFLPYLGSTLLYVATASRRQRAVDRSVERYVANSYAALAAMTSLIISFVVGALLNLSGQYGIGTIFMIATIPWYFTAKTHLDDDNWFNDQRQRLGEYLVQIGKRLTNSDKAPQPI